MKQKANAAAVNVAMGSLPSIKEEENEGDVEMADESGSLNPTQLMPSRKNVALVNSNQQA